MADNTSNDIDLEAMVWGTLHSETQDLLHVLGHNNVDEKTRMTRVVDYFADIPSEPDMSEAEVEARLTRMRTQIFNYEDDDIRAQPIDKHAIQKRYKNYERIAADHQKRRRNLNGNFHTKSEHIATAASAKICALSQTVTLFDSTGMMVRDNAETLQNFSAQGHHLTVYAPSDAFATLEAAPIEKHDLSNIQIQQLQTANIRALIVGNATGGAFYHESNLKAVFSSIPDMHYYAAAAWEKTCNLFRDNKSFAKQQELAKQKQAIPAIYYGQLGFGNPNEVAKLQAAAIKAIGVS